MSPKNKGVFSLVLLSFIIASIGVITRFLTPLIGVYWQILSRFLIALIIILLVFQRKIRWRVLLNSSKKDKILMILRSLATFGGATLWVMAVNKTKLLNLVLLDSLPYSAFLGWLLLKEKLSPEKLIWTLLATMGVIILSLKKTNISLTIGMGEIMLIFSGFLWSFRNISVKWQDSKINDWELASVMLLLSTLIYVLYIVVFAEPLPLKIFSPFVLVLTLIGGILNVGNFYITNYAFKRVEAILAGNILQLEVLFGGIFGYLIFVELPNFQEIIGGLVLLLAVYKINSIYNKKGSP